MLLIINIYNKLILGQKERIAKGNGFNVPAQHILLVLGVDKEKDGHVDFFAWFEALVLEAKALDLVKVRTELAGCDIVRGYAQ